MAEHHTVLFKSLMHPQSCWFSNISTDFAAQGFPGVQLSTGMNPTSNVDPVCIFFEWPLARDPVCHSAGASHSRVTLQDPSEGIELVQSSMARMKPTMFLLILRSDCQPDSFLQHFCRAPSWKEGRPPHPYPQCKRKPPSMEYSFQYSNML